MVWLRRLIAGLLPLRPSFDPGLLRVEFVVDKLALGQVCVRELRISSLVGIIPAVLRIFIVSVINAVSDIDTSKLFTV